jgi:hypothetical protein
MMMMVAPLNVLINASYNRGGKEYHIYALIEDGMVV